MIFGKSVLDYVAIIIAIGAAVAINRSNLKKQTITELQDLVTTLQTKVAFMVTEIDEKDKRICHLEEVIDGYSELVREGYLAGSLGPRRGNSPATSKTTKNRGS